MRMWPGTAPFVRMAWSFRARDCPSNSAAGKWCAAFPCPLRQGEIVGLLGPNGAGKKTTFHMLVGILKPNAGEVRLGGNTITTLPLFERARAGLSYLPQESSVFKGLTVRENLDIILEYTGLSSGNSGPGPKNFWRNLGLPPWPDKKAMHLSGGERRRLEIARALIRHPRFILLDEPFAGIDPLAVDDIQITVGRFAGQRESGS